MDAKKCDRCGCYYEATNSYSLATCIITLGEGTDLCPSCKKSFIKWVNKSDKK